MGYYFQKELPEFWITYFHDVQNCTKCKLAMESNMQIGRPRKRLLKKKRAFSDNIQPGCPKILVKANLITKQTFQLSKQSNPIKSDKKVMSKKKVKNMLPPPVKALVDMPHKKVIKKKKNSNKVDAVKIENFLSDTKKKNLKRAQKVSKSTKEKPVVLKNVKSNSVKKSSDKGKGIKIPGKGTLKRKRWICDRYNQENENHEDDMYEMKEFAHFRSLLADDSDSSVKYDELKTPDFAFCLTPRQTTPSPVYKDCYDLAQLKKSRAKAEQYIYRRNKKKKTSRSKNVPKAPEDEQPVSTDDVTNKLEQVVRILRLSYSNNEKVIKNTNSEKTSESEDEDDQYFSDLQDNQNAVDSIR